MDTFIIRIDFPLPISYYFFQHGASKEDTEMDRKNKNSLNRLRRKFGSFKITGPHTANPGYGLVRTFTDKEEAEAVKEEINTLVNSWIQEGKVNIWDSFLPEQNKDLAWILTWPSHRSPYWG